MVKRDNTGKYKELLRRGVSCHLFDDEGNVEALHQFALHKLHFSRRWFQDDPRLPHYDILSDYLRDKAIKCGAKEVGRRHWVTVKERPQP